MRTAVVLAVALCLHGATAAICDNDDAGLLAATGTFIPGGVDCTTALDFAASSGEDINPCDGPIGVLDISLLMQLHCPMTCGVFNAECSVHPHMSTADGSMEFFVGPLREIAFVQGAQRTTVQGVVDALAGHDTALEVVHDTLEAQQRQIQQEASARIAAISDSSQSLQDQITTRFNLLRNSLEAQQSAIDGDISGLTTMINNLEIDLRALNAQTNADLQEVRDCSEQGGLWSPTGCQEIEVGQIPQDTPDSACNSDAGGKLRYNPETGILQMCSGAEEEWDEVFQSSGFVPGTVANTPARSCEHVWEASRGEAETGVYFVRPASVTYQVRCDMETTDQRGNSGFALLLANSPGTRFDFPSTHWTSTSVHNNNNMNPNFGDAKYQAFNDLPVRTLLLRSEFGTAQVKLERLQTLRAAMNGNTQLLERVNGRTPGELADNRGYNHCGHMWRLNSRGSYRMQFRIGGWVTYYWSCGYGSDRRGQPTGASCAGFGLIDQTWGGFSHARKSFGVRHAHDYQPQASRGGQIWGKA